MYSNTVPVLEKIWLNKFSSWWRGKKGCGFVMFFKPITIVLGIAKPRMQCGGSCKIVTHRAQKGRESFETEIVGQWQPTSCESAHWALSDYGLLFVCNCMIQYVDKTTLKKCKCQYCSSSSSVELPWPRPDYISQCGRSFYLGLNVCGIYVCFVV